MCVDVYRRVRAGHPWRDGLMLLCCLFGGWFVFWSICSTKLPHYLLPVYPDLSLLTACFLEGWVAAEVRVGRGWMRSAWLSTMIVGACMTAALPIVAMYLLPGEEWIGAIGLILILGGGLAWRFAAQGKRLAAVRCYALASIAFLTAAFGFVTVGVDRHQNARPMMAEIRRDNGADAVICEYGFHRKSTVYYAGHPISLCNNPEELRKLLDSEGVVYIITIEKYQEEIERNNPGEFAVLMRQHRFTTVVKPIEAIHARPGEVVVLKRVAKPGCERVARKADTGHAT